MNMRQNDTDASLDSQTNLKKRSRRRLVGAAALALLAAIVLPMVMDREPRQPAQDVQVKIPSQDSGLASRVLPNKPAVTPLPSITAEPKSPTIPTADVKLPDATREAAAPIPTPTDKLLAKIVDKPVEKTAKVAEKPAEKVAQSKAQESTALAALNGSSGTLEQWVVQLGAYKEAGNVKVLLAKLKQMSVPAFTDSIDTSQGARTRVRAGPFKTREAAEKAKTRIHTIGVDGTVAAK